MSRFLALVLFVAAPIAWAAEIGPIAPVRPAYAPKQGDAYAPKDLSSNLKSASTYLNAAASYLSENGAEPAVLDEIALEIAFGDALLADAEAALAAGIPGDGHFGTAYHANGVCPPGDGKACEATELSNALGHLATLVDSYRAAEAEEKRIKPRYWLERAKANLAKAREGLRAAGIPAGQAVSEERLGRDRTAVEEARKRGGKRVGLDFDPQRGSAGGPSTGGEPLSGTGSSPSEGLTNPLSQGKAASRTTGAGSALTEPSAVQASALSRSAAGVPLAPAAQRPKSFVPTAAAPPPLSARGDTPAAVSGAAGGTASETGGATEGGAGGESDEAVIRRVFSATVSQLTASGQRASGSGSVSGVYNNFSTLWNDKRMRCFDQAEVLQGKLNEAFARRESRARWTFELRSYTGDKDHEKNGHWWVQASSKDWPRQKTLTLDPWANSVKVEDSQNPVVIKPYAAYWMGYVMDKVTN